MVKFSDLFGKKSQAEAPDAYWRHFDTLPTSVFVSTTLDGVMLFFSGQQRKKCM